MTAAAQLTVETAPRDLAALTAAGRFNLRALANELNAFNGSEEEKQAFMSGSTPQMAEFVLKHLQLKDGAAKSKATGTGGATRAPTTKNASKGAGVAGKPTGTAAAGTGGGGTQTTTTAPPSPGNGAGVEKLLAAINQLTEQVKENNERLESMQGSIAQLQHITGGTNRFVALSIGLAGKLAEETLGAHISQILPIVLEDMPAVEAAMRQLPGADEAEAEEEVEEGNGE